MHPNEETARRGYTAFQAGDMATLDEIMSDDVVWNTAGNNRFSGAYVGKEATFGLFAELMQASGGTFKNELHDVLANDDHIVGLVHTTASDFTPDDLGCETTPYGN